MSEILKQCHDLAKDLHKVGAMNDEAFASMEALCTLENAAEKSKNILKAKNDRGSRS